LVLTCCPPSGSLPDKKCGSETAYASGANTYNLDDLGCTDAWGYYQKYRKDVVEKIPVNGVVYTANLPAGRTNDVGDVTVTKTSATCFTVTLGAAPKYGVGITQIEISCKDPVRTWAGFAGRPGSMSSTGCITTDPYASGEVCEEAVCANFYYFIIHAETYSIVSADEGDTYENCAPYVCSG
jgi:hypothetical protein